MICAGARRNRCRAYRFIRAEANRNERSKRDAEKMRTVLPEVLDSPFIPAGIESGERTSVSMRQLSVAEGPMILGLITTKDVLRHTRTIVREFGAATYLRCCLGALRRRQTTFLECISPPSRNAARAA